MTLVAEMLLTSPDLPLTDVASTLPTPEITLEYFLGLADQQVVFVLSVDDQSKDTFETELDRHSDGETISTPGKTTERWFYQIRIAELSALYASFASAESQAAPIDVTITPEGWRTQKLFPDREAFARFRDRCTAHGISYRLTKLSSTDVDSQSQSSLTERQREALELAFSSGYYENPRQVSTAELGDRLGISAGSVSELLRRAERQLIGQILAPAEYINTPTG